MASSTASPMRTLAGLLRDRPLHFAGACLFGTCATLLALAPYVIVWWLIVMLLEGRATSAGILWAAVWLGVSVLARHACFALSSVLSHFAAFDVQVRLRRTMVGRLFRVPLGLFDRNRESVWRTALVDDVEAAEDGLAHLVPELTAIGLGAAAAAALMLWTDWRLGIAALAPLAAAVVIMQRMQRKAEPAADAYRESCAELNGVSAELARGVAVLKLFNEGGQATARLERVSQAFIASVRDWVRLCLLPGNLFSVLIGASLVLVVPLGLVLLEAGRTTVSDILLVVLLCFGLGEIFIRLGDFIARIGRQETILARIADLSEAPEIAFGGEAVALGPPRIVFDEVSFAYGTAPVLRGISLEVPAGGLVALVGPSGGGKSTIARLAARFFDPQSGSVSVGGADLRRLPSAQLSGLVATVFQDPVLFSDSVAANIRVGREDADDAAVANAARLAHAHEFILGLPDGYATRLHEGGRSLSLGQRQRVAIARALLCDAPVLVLDEVTAFADPETETLVQRALGELLGGRRTVLMIAHRLRTVMGADRILVIDGGRVVESGRHEELLARGGLYARLWASQTRGTRLDAPPARSAAS